MRAAMTHLNVSVWAYHCILIVSGRLLIWRGVKMALTIVNRAGSEKIQSMHLVDGLRVSQLSKVDAQHGVMS